MFGIDKSLLTGLDPSEQYRLIGNSVPQAIGAHIGRCIKQLIVPEILEERRTSWLQKYEAETPKTGREADDREVHTYALRNQMRERIQNTLRQNDILPSAAGEVNAHLSTGEGVEARLEDMDMQAALHLLTGGS